MRALINLFVYALTIAIVLTVGSGYWLMNEYKDPGPLVDQRIFTVAQGQNASDIAENLEAQGVIRSAFVFRFALKYLDSGVFLKAGEYEIAPGSSIQQVIASMQSGRTIQYQVMIPECVTSFEVMNILNAAEGLEGQIVHPPLEGTVYPDTYNFIKGEARSDVLERMQKAMDIALENAWRLGQSANLPYKTPREMLVMASIVEKEAGKPEERQKVAGLFVNRLKQDMRLQSDPTVIYGIVDGRPQTGGVGPLGRRLLKKDLDFDSPYNTYMYGGLPPGPICNPGKSSLEAVMSPEAHNYIYMVADGTGGHVFGETLREHNANVAQWRKIRAQNEQKQKAAPAPQDKVDDEVIDQDPPEEQASPEAQSLIQDQVTDQATQPALEQQPEQQNSEGAQAQELLDLQNLKE